MALGRQRERQSDILVSWAELPRSPGHAFYDKLQTVLIASDFDRFVEMQCASELRAAARPPIAAGGSLLPHAAGRLFRRHRQRAWSGMALRRQPVVTRIPPARRARARAGS